MSHCMDASAPAAAIKGDEARSTAAWCFVSSVTLVNLRREGHYC